MKRFTKQMKQHIKLVVLDHGLLTSLLSTFIVRQALVQIGLTFGVVEPFCSLLLPRNRPVGLTLQLMTVLKEVVKCMKLITHPDGVLASGLVARHQTNASIRGHADTLKMVDVLPGMNAGASTSAVPSPIEGSGTAWVLLGAWALSPARPTPIHPWHECRGFSALMVSE